MGRGPLASVEVEVERAENGEAGSMGAADVREKLAAVDALNGADAASGAVDAGGPISG